MQQTRHISHKVRSAEAKDAEALKKKNAELYKIYKQYDGFRKNGVTLKG